MPSAAAGSRLLSAYHDALTQRSVMEPTWAEIAALIHPTRAHYRRGSASSGPRSPVRTQVYDSTALLAAENLAAGLFGALTNPASRWFRLEAEDQAWADGVEQVLNGTLNAGGQAFYTVLPDFFRDLVSFGTAVLAVRPGPRFVVRRLEDLAIEADGDGAITRLFRRFRLRAGAALRRFGPNTPEALRRSAGKDGQSTGAFIEITEWPDEAAGTATTPASSGRSSGALHTGCRVTVIDAETGRVLESRTRPESADIVVRWSAAGGGAYGDSPAMLALPDVKTLNAMCKASLLAAQKAVDPPILSAHEHGMRGLKTHPGAVIYGGLDANGRRLYQPFMDGGDPGLSLEMEQQRRMQIREAFFASLLLGTAQGQETATAFLGRQEEKARLLAPHLARLQSEFLEPLIRRLFGLLYRAGALPRNRSSALHPDIPTVQLISPLAQAQRLSEAARHLRLLDGLSGLGLEQGQLVDEQALARSILSDAGFPERHLRPDPAP